MAPSLETYKRMLSKSDGITSGMAKRSNANMIMEATWYDDTQSRICYIYDYYHDSEPEKNVGLKPWEDPLKTKIDAKYIRVQSNTLSKDQVEYHLMFRPSQKCPLDYYKEKYTDRYGSEFPVGLYVDVPDSKGIYRRWLICANDYEPLFNEYIFLPCDYRFMWIESRIKHYMWGSTRSQNSYNSGVWRDYIFQTSENQKKMWLPQNDISDTIFYDQRLIISSVIKEPITWKVSKVENDSPSGINKFTVVQDKFNPNTDYVNFETNEMFADYYDLAIPPKGDTPPDQTGDYCEIVVSGTSSVLKVGGSPKRITANIVLANGEVYDGSINWSFLIDDEDASDKINILYDDSDMSIEIRAENESLIGSILSVTATTDDGIISGTTQLEIVGL